MEIKKFINKKEEVSRKVVYLQTYETKHFAKRDRFIFNAKDINNKNHPKYCAIKHNNQIMEQKHCNGSDNILKKYPTQ